MIFVMLIVRLMRLHRDVAALRVVIEHLTALDLSDTQLDDAAVRALAGSFHTNNGLRALDLSGAMVSAAALGALSVAFSLFGGAAGTAGTAGTVPAVTAGSPGAMPPVKDALAHHVCDVLFVGPQWRAACSGALHAISSCLSTQCSSALFISPGFPYKYVTGI